VLLPGLTPQGTAFLHSLIERQMLQLIFHSHTQRHQRVTVDQQLPLIAFLPRWCPDPGKAILHQ
jgi:hypothetical protein